MQLLYQKLNFEDHDDLKMFLYKSNNILVKVSALNQLGALRKKHFDFEIETLEDEGNPKLNNEYIMCRILLAICRYSTVPDPAEHLGMVKICHSMLCRMLR